MKKILITILLALSLIGTTVTLTSCRVSNPFERPMTYYGCPNSKRINRLKLKKRSK